MQSRRLFMGSTAAPSLASIAYAAPAVAGSVNRDEILVLFDLLPGKRRSRSGLRRLTTNRSC